LRLLLRLALRITVYGKDKWFVLGSFTNAANAAASLFEKIPNSRYVSYYILLYFWKILLNNKWNFRISKI